MIQCRNNAKKSICSKYYLRMIRQYLLGNVHLTETQLELACIILSHPEGVEGFKAKHLIQVIINEERIAVNRNKVLKIHNYYRNNED